MMVQPPQTQKYDSNGKGGYFRFDDDYKMGYKYTSCFCFFQIQLQEDNNSNYLF